MPVFGIFDRRPLEIAIVDADAGSANATNYTFTSKALGTADDDRKIIVGVGTSVAGGGLPSSVTIGGVTASRIQSSSLGTNPTVDVWSAIVPSGITGNIIVSYSGNASRAVSIVVYASTPNPSVTYSSNKGGVSNAANDVLAIPATGFALGFAAGNGTGTASWAGLSEDADFTNASVHVFTSASFQSASGDAAKAAAVTFATATVNSTAFVVFGP